MDHKNNFRLNKTTQNRICRITFSLFFMFCLVVIISQDVKALPIQPIMILKPGDGSLVSSPIEINALLFPGEDSLVRVSLIDKHQTLLARHVVRFSRGIQNTFEFVLEIPFEISKGSSEAVLVIAIWDSAHRPIAERTVELTLCNSANTVLFENKVVESWLQVDYPTPGEEIQSSSLVVKGTVRPLNDSPIFISLVNQHKSEVGTRQLPVKIPGEPIDFDIALLFPATTTNQEMRLVIRQAGKIGGVNAILDSIPLRLIP